MGIYMNLASCSDSQEIQDNLATFEFFSPVNLMKLNSANLIIKYSSGLSSRGLKFYIPF